MYHITCKLPVDKFDRHFGTVNTAQEAWDYMLALRAVHPLLGVTVSRLKPGQSAPVPEGVNATAIDLYHVGRRI